MPLETSQTALVEVKAFGEGWSHPRPCLKFRHGPWHTAPAPALWSSSSPLSSPLTTLLPFLQGQKGDQGATGERGLAGFPGEPGPPGHPGPPVRPPPLHAQPQGKGQPAWLVERSTAPLGSPGKGRLCAWKTAAWSWCLRITSYLEEGTSSAANAVPTAHQAAALAVHNTACRDPSTRCPAGDTWPLIHPAPLRRSFW